MPTFESFVMLLDNAQSTVDVSVMYWDLLGLRGTDNFSPEELKAFGLGRGLAVFEAFEVKI
jgi:hypothetical protein